MAREALHYARHSVRRVTPVCAGYAGESARVALAFYGGPVRQPDLQERGRLRPGTSLVRRATTALGITRCLGCLR